MRREIKFRAWNGRDMNYSPDLITPEGKLSPKGIGWLIIMQFTGLHDKNGKEIYEGDIVRLKNQNIGKIIYQTEHMRYVVNGETKFFSFVLTANIRRTEIIGNIYENPELLEVKR